MWGRERKAGEGSKLQAVAWTWLGVSSNGKYQNLSSPEIAFSALIH